jgi:hypothetical protein
MAKAYSADMRQRVIDRAESSASGREVARYYEMSPLYGSDPGEVRVLRCIVAFSATA